MVRMNKRPYPIAVGILGILTAMLVIGAGCGKSENGIEDAKKSSSNAVIYLNDSAVPREEYSMLAQEYCNQIYMQYSTEQVNSEDFWETEIDGALPWELLESIIEEELRYNYALKDLAEELEILEDFTYADLLESMDAENESKENLSENEVSYGLNGYEAASYYKYWYSNLETQVVSALIRDKIDVSQEDCRSYYDENPEEFAYDVGVDIWYAEIPYGEDMQQKEAQEIAVQLSKAMEKAGSTEELADVFSDISIQQMSLNSLDTQEGMSGVYSQRWSLASQLDAGEVYGPYEENGAFCVIKCIRRTENGSLDLDTVQPRIERYLQTQEAQRMIAEEMEQMAVKEGEITAKEVILETLERN